MITELTGFANLTKSLIATLKELKELLPEQEDRQRLSRQLQEAERQLALAEASTAKELGYDLCQCTFPPNIMLYQQEKTANICPSCGHSKRVGATVAFSE